MTSPDAATKTLWKFVRGDLEAVEFEKWLYGQPGLESQIGKDVYLAAISTDLSNGSEVWKIRHDAYEALLRIGLEAGRSVRFVDPL